LQHPNHNILRGILAFFEIDVEVRTAASLTQMVNKSMAAWTSAGSVGADVDVVTTSGVKSAGVESFTTVTGPVDGYYHVTDEVTTASGTYEVDLNVRLVEDVDGNVSDTYINGTIALSLTVGSSTVTYTMTFGDGTDDYHGTATWTAGSLTSIGASGPLLSDTLTSTAASSATQPLVATLVICTTAPSLGLSIIPKGGMFGWLMPTWGRSTEKNSLRKGTPLVTTSLLQTISIFPSIGSAASKMPKN